MTGESEACSFSIRFEARSGDLFLEQPRQGDQPWLDELGQDLKVSRFLGELKRTAQELNQTWEMNGYGIFVVRPSPGSPQAMAICGLVPATWKGPGEKELVCAVAPDYRGKGIATGACMAVLEWSRGRGLGPIFGRVAKSNQASIELIKKLPMRQVGSRPDHHDGIQAVHEWP